MSLECDNYVFQRLFFNNNKKSVKNLVTLAPSLGLEIRNTILKLSKTIPPLIQEGYRYRVGNILISFNFSGFYNVQNPGIDLYLHRNGYFPPSPPVLWIRIRIGSVFRSFLDPGQHSEYGSGSIHANIG